MPPVTPVGVDATSRSELRRRSAGATAALPAVVWGRPAVPSPAAEAVAPIAPAAEPVAQIAPAADGAPETARAEPVTRRRMRAQLATTSPAPAVEPVREAASDDFELREPDVVPPSVVIDEPEIFLEPETLLAADREFDGAAPFEAGDDAASAFDEFAEAAKLFSFTGETPIVTPVEEVAAPAVSPAASTVVASPRRSAGSSFRRVATASFSVGVMGLVGLLTVGMTTPAEAVAAASTVSTDGTVSIAAPGNAADDAEPEEIQAYVAPSDVTNAALERTEGYSTVSMAQIAAETGINYSSSVFTNDQNAPIQWPFAVGVGLSSGYGMRWGRMHEGLDFIPGAGAPIQAIADGTVRIATESGGAYGVTVYIDHIIDGQLITSHYAHMQYGSLQVTEGEHVTVGTIIGKTGNTGRSYGAHLHFELLVNGTTTIDPLPWLREHAGG
ncbi:MAG TPA: peptidoglycan DD-metalloendopeptidase family protein [Microbacterium sp.]|uniref:M23 family metallopeptidase n=1 Tax=Microbacterium sp. TaxID=51671 RepID=UPI002C6D83D2|nr:peptidoglycan DD-metalloendopeptidase family protein [Microbacterium sp.]HWI32329.1 peptidoglycan DD-metalloendopeptidase family protein [Microbacterium sp.]